MEKKTIGKFIAVMRKANGMTQRELAEKLNVSDKAISRWERDESAPDLTLIPALAEIFGITSDELLKGEKNSLLLESEKKEKKVEKQLRSLVKREISKFKKSSIISIALELVGIIVCLVINEAFIDVFFGYEDIVGFGSLLLFDITAVLITVLAMNNVKDNLYNNELFEEVDETYFDNVKSIVYKYSAIVFGVVIVPVFLGVIVFLEGSIPQLFWPYTIIDLIKMSILPLVWIFVLILPIYKRVIFGRKLAAIRKIRNVNIVRNILLILFALYACIPSISEKFFITQNIINAALLSLAAVIGCSIIKSFISKEKNS